ncbi:MAG: acetyl-CoA hydrolase, partial [Alphaproteobacteria bacterium]|nr:acetyl-CoA hydrolase [Alphaproteobacteria bacterium]
MVHRIAAGELPAWLRPGARVFVEGAAGEPTILLDALAAAPDASRGVEYLQVTIPGVNRRDPASFHPEARFTGFFVPPEFHASFAAGRMRFVPLNYNAVHAQVAAIDFDLALLSLSPPNAEGLCSFGVVADFPQSVRAKKIIAEINPRMPFVPGAPTIP